MKNYFVKNFDKNDFSSISIIDELPLWSAPFGLKLLETVKYKQGIKVLDIGCGTGFPLVELAQRLGTSCRVIGIDGWKDIIERANLKIKLYDLQYIFPVNAVAENMPFKNDYFDLIVSNNGINNVNDLRKTLSECCRICVPGAQFIFSFNLQETMIEFYSVFEKVLNENGLHNEIKKMKSQIYEKRKPLNEMINLVNNAGFTVNNVIEDYFKLGFTDAVTMFNHSLIKNWFLEGWEKVVADEIKEEIFSLIEEELNATAAKEGHLSLGIPFAVVDAVKESK